MTARDTYFDAQAEFRTATGMEPKVAAIPRAMFDELEKEPGAIPESFAPGLHPGNITIIGVNAPALYFGLRQLGEETTTPESQAEFHAAIAAFKERTGQDAEVTALTRMQHMCTQKWNYNIATGLPLPLLGLTIAGIRVVSTDSPQFYLA